MINFEEIHSRVKADIKKRETCKHEFSEVLSCDDEEKYLFSICKKCVAREYRPGDMKQ